MSDSSSTTLLRRHIGRWLAVLRQEAGYSQDDAAAVLQRGAATIWRMEAGDVRIRYRDIEVNAICDLYRVPPEVREWLLALTADTRADKKAWWHDFTVPALPPWLGIYPTLEDSVAMIRGYATELMPGLLQTWPYAEVANRLPVGRLAEPAIERRVAAQMERQEVLSRSHPPALRYLLSEAVLHRLVGGREVMVE